MFLTIVRFFLAGGDTIVLIAVFMLKQQGIKIPLWVSLLLALVTGFVVYMILDMFPGIPWHHVHWSIQGVIYAIIAYAVITFLPTPKDKDTNHTENNI